MLDAVENPQGRDPLNGVSSGTLDLTIRDLILLKKLLSAFAACSAGAVVAPIETTSHPLLRSRKVLQSRTRIPKIMLSLKTLRSILLPPRLAFELQIALGVSLWHSIRHGWCAKF